MSNFRPFADAVAKRFAEMSKHELFRVNIPGDDVWNTYLAAFPEGTNPIHRKRPYFDGSYDRAFVRRLGNVVAIGTSGQLCTLWELPDLEYPFNVVAAKLDELVRNSFIVDLFRTKELSFGYTSTREHLEDGSVHQWFHFNAKTVAKHQSRDVDTVLGNYRTTVQVFARGMNEITRPAIDTVIELIQNNNLYKGEEFLRVLTEYRQLMRSYDALETERLRDLFLWQNAENTAARVRNTAIGTLLQDLSEGQDLERAVKSYETKVAPTNYRRPTALITQSMIKNAEKTINELGIEPSLQRRHARLSDVSINDVLWADGSAAARMMTKSSISNLLSEAIAQAAPRDQKQISIEDFMSMILPTATGIELFLANQLEPNLVSVTAPVDPEAPPLFKWGNGFAWSYKGNVTDSIKEKVKAAGGNIDAKLRVSLAWFNTDDLDLHAECPDGHVFYGAKFGTKHGSYYYDYSGSGGHQILDVDMNAGGPQSRTPVENLSWAFPKEGRYKISVNQYNKRSTTDIGFVLEIENEGNVTQYTYRKGVSSMIDALEFEIIKGRVHNLRVIDKDITGQGIQQDRWGLKTESYVRVETIMLSPNHWSDQVTGNKHYFFILEGCKNDEPARGIYNEYLLPELAVHGKVFEVLGNKTKCEPTSEQLSGVGFSSTKREKVTAKVTDRNSTTRIYEILF